MENNTNGLVYGDFVISKSTGFFGKITGFAFYQFEAPQVLITRFQNGKDDFKSHRCEINAVEKVDKLD